MYVLSYRREIMDVQSYHLRFRKNLTNALYFTYLHTFARQVLIKITFEGSS